MTTPVAAIAPNTNAIVPNTNAIVPNTNYIVPNTDDSAAAANYHYQPVPAAPVAPVASSRSGLPFFIAGATLFAIAVCHLMLLPEWIATKTSDGVVGNLTGVVAEVGIGAALVAVGFTRRRHQR